MSRVSVGNRVNDGELKKIYPSILIFLRQVLGVAARDDLRRDAVAPLLAVASRSFSGTAAISSENR